MSNIWIRSRNALSRSLDAEEREAVFGDLDELGLTDRQAVKSVLGLVMRRQLRLWKEWGPWFALAAITLPVCPLLATSSSELAVGIWPSVWMKLHHGVYYDTGLSPVALMAGFCFRATALITWSWTSGFALGTFSRRTIWVSGNFVPCTQCRSFAPRQVVFFWIFMADVAGVAASSCEFSICCAPCVLRTSPKYQISE